MIEIKFRAWDRTDKLMYVDIQDGINFDDGSHYSFSQFLQWSGNDDDYHVWEVMQYTGLKDKNSKEIYEGDIVNHGDNYPSIVRFGIKSYGFELEEPGYDDEGYGSRWHEFIYLTSPIEVIGNIYENPELLERTQ